MIYVAYLTHGIQIKYKTDSSDEFVGIIFWNDIVMPQDILKNIHSSQYGNSLDYLNSTVNFIWIVSLTCLSLRQSYIHILDGILCLGVFILQPYRKEFIRFQLASQMHKINENKSTIWSHSLLDNDVTSLVQP